LKGKYDMINIKLDKTGGLTEALALRADAQAAGFEIMVGCMDGSSLAMAPAGLVAQGAMMTDLDGPLLLAEDRADGLRFDDSGVHPPSRALWG
ncbi:MAG TPA: dipeptide epimerase, partial [Rhodobacterales bacterium]|nr:dipeptide epimerase [Rhodobacterales bacterium]